MSDAGYWTSLRQAGVFIYLSLFCLFAALAVFIYLYDRISALALWNSSLWLKIKVPLIILGVIGFVVGVLAFARYQGQKELAAAQQYAQSQGWGFSHHDTEGLTAQASEILWDLKGLSLYHIRTVEPGARSLHLFDCSYNHKDDAASRRASYGVAAMIRSERFRRVTAPVDIVSRDWTEFMISNKVDMGMSPFTEKFLVLSKDPAAAKATVSEAVQAIMIEHLKKPLYNPVCVTIAPTGATVLTYRTDEPERLQDLIELVRAIEAAGK